VEAGTSLLEFGGPALALAGYFAQFNTLPERVKELERERDELFARLADLSWEALSEREKMVWAVAFAAREVWSGELSVGVADEAVKALREKLK
jgi:hypothetical protein